ncbi:MAG: phosphoribosylformylglycinamidine synthase subunit PurL [Endomicrobia bacterium]|nr:phosphoribosylformylglycinamidine synthase subunit PurL [Endomicrobiia bacterium]MCL2507324.1 phosphoribosylformylglycinamidine synthase subunit PurL [Endomicrobiia bacterium]
MNSYNIEILKLSDKDLVTFSKKNSLSLNLKEMKAVQNYFKKIKREPTKAELETIAQTWSEHCKHKTLTGIIKYKGTDAKGKKVNVTYQNMLKETIFKATMELNKPWCLSVFRDNAGVIEFDKSNGIAFKDETHNHPSALNPYAGAATGVGGCVRDIMGVGIGAKPLAVTGVLCVGNPETPAKNVPKGSHHPKYTLKNAVEGVRDYSRDHGIPVINGSVRFDDGYMANPLVYAGVMGIMPKNTINKEVKTGDLAVAVGRKTWRDGIHGATMSSMDLDETANASGVPQGDPKLQKKILDAQLKARDLKLYRAVTDCGAGGYSSAFGELGEKTGVHIELEKLPLLKENCMEPWEIWVSETQERMAFVVPPKNIKKFIDIFKKAGIEAVVIGKFTSDKKLTLTYDNNFIAQMGMEFLHKGVPKSVQNAVYTPKKETLQKPVKFNAAKIKESLKKVLADLAVCSQEPIISQYDSEVQGQTAVKPLAGGVPSDASVICPNKVIKGTKKGIVLSHGLNPEYGKVNTYKMAASSVEEALRNAVAVGANPDRTAVLDNFCWGNPNKPEVLGSLVAAARACYDMSKKFGVPFISGKDSLYNEYAVGGKNFAIPSALLISAMGVADNVKNTMTMDFKRVGNVIMLLGLTRNELGQSVFSRVNKISGGVVSEVYPDESLAIMRNIYKAANKGLIETCHDISAGGIATAVSEMSFAGKKCAKINIDAVAAQKSMTPAEVLFSESNGRFLVEVSPKNAAKIKALFKGSIVSEIGEVCDCGSMIFESAKNKIKVSEKTETLLKSWKNTIKLK